MRWLLTSMPGGKLWPWAARVAAARLTFRGRSVVVGREANDEGIDDSFELEFEVPEKVQTGLFVGDCFVYTTHSMRLNYVVGGKVTTLHHLGESPSLRGPLTPNAPQPVRAQIGRCICSAFCPRRTGST